MDDYLAKCSICFDAHCEFCLEHCRDQFCRACFGRYVGELVRGSSWGVARVEIKCPACMEPLQRHEWARFVPADVLAEYDRNSRPFKSLVRGCPTCGHEHQAATSICTSSASSSSSSTATVAQREQRFWEVHSLLAEVLADAGEHGASESAAILDEYRSMFRAHLRETLVLAGGSRSSSSDNSDSSRGSNTGESDLEEGEYTEDEYDDGDDDETPLGSVVSRVTVTQIYGRIAEELQSVQAAFEQRQQQRRPRSSRAASKRRRTVSPATAASTTTSYDLEFPALNARPINTHPSRISALLISLEKDEKAWRALQFRHVATYPHVECTQCHGRFCFQCGEASWHVGVECVEYMRAKVGRWIEERGLHAAAEVVPSPSFGTCADGNDCNMTGTNYTVASSSSPPSQPRLIPRQLPGFPATRATPDDIATLQWKLANSKRCPQCCTLINRDDGCNKVDCVMCAHRFCWVCLSPWGTNCGFYRCQVDLTAAVEPGAEGDATAGDMGVRKSDQATTVVVASPRVPEESVHTELGVPNITLIQRRLTASQLPV